MSASGCTVATALTHAERVSQKTRDVVSVEACTWKMHLIVLAGVIRVQTGFGASLFFLPSFLLRILVLLLWWWCPCPVVDGNRRFPLGFDNSLFFCYIPGITNNP